MSTHKASLPPCNYVYIRVCVYVHAHSNEPLTALLQMMAKFAEDDRLEQMNAQKRRMKQLEHRRAVEKLIEERREQFQREKVRVVEHAHNAGIHAWTQ